MALNHQNNYTSSISASAAAGATATQLSAVPSVDAPFWLVFDYDNANSHYEPILCTAKTSSSVIHTSTAYAHSAAELVAMIITAEELDSLNDEIESTYSTIEDSIPTGNIVIQTAETVPDGFLRCDGTAVSRTVYSALFTAIGTTYGEGDGTTTFNLPDAGGRALFGVDSDGAIMSAVAMSGGVATASFAHTHTQDSHTHAFSSGLTGNQNSTNNHNTDTTPEAYYVNGTHTHPVTAATISASGDNITTSGLATTVSLYNPYITLLVLIKT
jgi:microcystin-dependent protein